MASERETITVQERFTKPCTAFPDGLWERKIGSLPWEVLGDHPPVVFLNAQAENIVRSAEVTPQEAEFIVKHNLLSGAAAPKKEGQ